MDLASEIAIGFIYEIFAKIKSPEMLCIKFEFFNVSEVWFCCYTYTPKVIDFLFMLASIYVWFLIYMVQLLQDDLVHMRSITDTRMTERFLPKLELGREILLKKKIERQEKVSSL